MQDNNILRIIDTLGISGPTILDKILKDGGGEMTRRISTFKIFQESVCITLSQICHRIKVYVER